MFVVMALTAVVGPVAEVDAQEAVDVVPVESGPEAIEALELDAADVADDYDLSSTELRSELREDDTLHVDANGELLYVDPRPPGEPAAPDGSEAAGEGAGDEFPLLPPRPPIRSSCSTAVPVPTTRSTWTSTATPRAGRAGTRPTASTRSSRPPTTSTVTPASWSAAELSRIASVWDRVAEDFSPFDVDVTTQEPDVEALRRTSGADGRVGHPGRGDR